MKRRERVCQYVEEQTSYLKQEELNSVSGLTTQEVAKALGIQRTNASKDLNELVRLGQLDKLDGRPVRYISKEVYRHKPLSKYVPSYREISEVEPSPVEQKTRYSDDVFKRIIGTTGSMKNPMEQAKASILYPPKGLNCLIIGPTGSGKTYFAHTMYHFAKQNMVINPEKEFIVFNCADYASNPELLMSHLFGHVKGAFTGADQEKDGLITLADDSVLFLDEIHRLPPEGQEMIFYFMDNGKFAKLGESTKERRASVRIICATTEDPNSVLLNTFVRRLPITIQLPNFKDRSAREKIELVRMMMALESKRIQRRIVLTEDVVKALIGSVSYGNVGQLKSNVQLVTAKAFLSQMEKDELVITLDELNDSIKEGLIHLGNDRITSAELTSLLGPKMEVSPNESLETNEEDAYELPYNLYDIIGDKAALLREDGLSQEVINHFIATDINVHLKSFYRNHGFTFDTENKLSEIIDASIIETTKKIHAHAVEELGYDFQSNFLYAVGLHISSFLHRLSIGEIAEREENENILDILRHCPREFSVAKSFKDIIEAEHGVTLPNTEINYLTVLLVSLKESRQEGRIGIVVASHGLSTATSMVQVATELLKANNVRPVDMPLDMRPKEALELVIREVREVDEGSGVLLLVDMGSLSTFSEEIKNRTGISVKVVDMVTTSLVLEAVRKSSLLETDLITLHNSLIDFHGYRSSLISNKDEIKKIENKQQAILAICASGKGTAQRMKQLIDDYLINYMEEKIEVLPISVINMSDKIKELAETYDIIASTGIKDPGLLVPFLPMERLFSVEGPRLLEDTVLGVDATEPTPELTESTAKNICLTYLSDSYTFINPSKIIEPLWEMCEVIADAYPNEIGFGFYINLSMHVAGAIERSLRKEELSTEDASLIELEKSELKTLIRRSLAHFDDLLSISFSDSEVYYILKILENELIR